MSETPLVYLIYGIPDSERRSVLFDLFESGLSPEQQLLYFRPKDEKVSPYDEQIETLENVSTVEWELKDCKVKHGRITAAPEKVFFLAPGNSDPADVAEALKEWTTHNNCELGRIVTILNCSFLQAQEKSRRWFDACIHFSDIVLLARRESVDNKWVKDFETHYRKQCYPCLFEIVSKGKTKNPATILEPEARRMSLFFDELIPIAEDEFEDGERPEDTKPDRYIERNESGQRIQRIPDIAELLA
ncbi:MAG: GTP-binding protein [Opitutales bacterium]